MACHLLFLIACFSATEFSVTELHSQYCSIKRMHNRVTVSDKISLIYTVLHTEVLKTSKLSIINM